MQMDKSIEILSFLKTQSRNKIVFYKDSIIDITAIDLGAELSQALFNLNDLTKLPMKVTSELDKIFNDALINHSNYGRIIAISNIGILLEPDLKQDLRAILEKYSNNNTLFVKWVGEIENRCLNFLSKEKGIKINTNELSHIIL